jgi:hypothetical protein
MSQNIYIHVENIYVYVFLKQKDQKKQTIDLAMFNARRIEEMIKQNQVYLFNNILEAVSCNS